MCCYFSGIIDRRIADRKKDIIIGFSAAILLFSDYRLRNLSVISVMRRIPLDMVPKYPVCGGQMIFK